MARVVEAKEPWAIGLMSGTSLDGIDVALIRTDGEAWVEAGAFQSRPYAAAFRAKLRDVLGGRGPVAAVERELTLLHAGAVRAVMADQGIGPGEVAMVGFHGHTIDHDPAAGRTWQIGDGALLAAETGIDVVCDFRSRDVAEGGQGAPFAPLYHRAVAAGLARPLAVLNIGGVANVTWVGCDDSEILAFDTGPGNALIDDWALGATGNAQDTDGALARAGRVDPAVLARLMAHGYFDLPPPKSLDRNDFDPTPAADLGPEDGAATLTAFTAAAVARAAAFFPAPPDRWLVCGGGRHNPVLMAALRERTGVPVEPVEAVGWDGDALEAQAFAYLAVRSLKGLPLSLPATTGVARPTCGGRLFVAA